MPFPFISLFILGIPGSYSFPCPAASFTSASLSFDGCKQNDLFLILPDYQETFKFIWIKTSIQKLPAKVPQAGR